MSPGGLNLLAVRRWFWAAGIALGIVFRALGAERGPIVHQPFYPKSGEPVRITVSGALPAEVAAAVEYQVVRPGKYFGKDDPQYEKEWKRVPLAAGSAGVRSATVPGEVQKNRHLIRYRVVDAGSGKRLLPADGDSVPNFAWFVYDGIPAWSGAINPDGDRAGQKPLTIPAEAMRRVQAYHLVTKSEWVTQSQWTRPTEFGDEEQRSAYRWSGALVSDDGTVYDHIRYRARGGQWRHAMGKNMWKFDFNAGHKFVARDDFDRSYRAAWGKLNLGACIQPGQYGMRGEQGLFESVGFRLFNLAGVPAPRTHYVHFRIVRHSEEIGSTQYDGDFFGLYLAVENVDGSFIKEHELPRQSLFKMEFGTPDHSYDGQDGVVPSHVLALMRSLHTLDSSEKWGSKVNLPEYLDYRSILECIHHYDIGSGKNYFFRRDPVTKRWSTVPWDLDLTWGDHMYGDGREPFYAARVFGQPGILQDYRNRLGEVITLLYNEDQAGALIDEMAAVVADPREKASLAEADRRHWDWHPMISGPLAGSFQASPGTFYQMSPTHDFHGMRTLMKQYVRDRGAYLIAKHRIPKTPASKPMLVGQTAEAVTLKSEISGAKRLEWRLGDVTRGTAGARRTPNSYEIEPIWTTNGVSEVSIPVSVLKPGRNYRARVRAIDESGAAGFWSEPVEVTR